MVNEFYTKALAELDFPSGLFLVNMVKLSIVGSIICYFCNFHEAESCADLNTNTGVLQLVINIAILSWIYKQYIP